MRLHDNQASAPESVALTRLCFWEEQKYSASLQQFLHEGGYPFIVRYDDCEHLRSHAHDCERGELIELFMLPIDLGGLLRHLKQPHVAVALEVAVDLSDMPMVLLWRRQSSSGRRAPHLEFTPALQLLPKWPATNAPLSLSAHCAPTAIAARPSLS